MPGSYLPIPFCPSKLLSHIYDNLQAHIENCSPRESRAILSYILTITFRPYIKELVQNVLSQSLDNIQKDTNPTPQNTFDKTGNIEPKEGMISVEDSTIKLPSFFSKELCNSLTVTGKSARILHSISPCHPSLLISANFPEELNWLWTEEDIRQVLKRREASLQHENAYDVAHAHRSEKDISGAETFVQSYPESLPSSSPTLSKLTSVVLEPLLKYAQSLNAAALRLFMDPSTPLHFRTHLVVLRSYFLLASDTFRTRLTDALFADLSEDEDREIDGKGEGDGGSVSKARLQTIIADSVRQGPKSGARIARNIRAAPAIPDPIWEDLEQRLDFVIRDSTLEMKNEAWLAPTCKQCACLYMTMSNN